MPTYHVWTHTTKNWAIGSWHWAFMAQPSPFPERLISAVPAEFFLKSFTAPNLAPTHRNAVAQLAGFEAVYLMHRRTELRASGDRNLGLAVRVALLQSLPGVTLPAIFLRATVLFDEWIIKNQASYLSRQASSRLGKLIEVKCRSRPM